LSASILSLARSAPTARTAPAAPGAGAGTQPLVAAERVSRRFESGRVAAVVDVSLALAPGEYVALTGPSGCGKSTLLHLLGTLERPDSGAVRYRGTDCAGTDAAALRATRIGFVFQACHLIPTLSAVDNVELPMLETRWRAAERRRRALALLDAVGLADRGAHRPSQLSGGQRQRVAIARALANEPELVIADEPTGNLDSANAARCLALLADLRRARGLTLIVATHDAAVAAGADRIVRLRDGRIENERA